MSLGQGIPGIVGAIYFLINCLGIILVGFHFYQKSAFLALLNYFWQRRVVFLSLTVYFLDTATDIVVALSWLRLMEDEADDGVDYESIDMKTFFWPMMGCFFLYQLLLMFSSCDSKHKWDVLLAPLQLYPFRALWVSLDESNEDGIVAKLEEEARSNQQMAAQKKVYGDDDDDADDAAGGIAAEAPASGVTIEVTTMDSQREDDEKSAVEPPTPGNDAAAANVPAVVDQDSMSPQSAGQQQQQQRASALVAEPAIGELDEHDPSKQHRFLLLLQCVFETVPGLLLQIVFWMKSANDPVLHEDSSGFLMPFSIAVSIVTVTDRFVRYIDDLYVVEEAKKRICGPYIGRVVYRMASIVASFVVLSMLWVIVGGLWIGIWCALSFVGWMVAASLVEGQIFTSWHIANGVRNMIAVPVLYHWKWHTVKFVEHMLGMLFVLVLLWLDIDDDVFVSLDTRSGLNDHGRVQFVFAVGWLAAVVAFVVYLVMLRLHILIVVTNPEDIVNSWSRGKGHSGASEAAIR